MRAQVGRHRYFWGTALTISLLHAIAAVAATREWVPIGSGGSVVALVIDASTGASDQDAAIGGEADRAGRGIVIIVNKWDLVKTEDHTFVQRFDDALRHGMRFLDYAPILHISALTGERTTRVLETMGNEKLDDARKIYFAEYSPARAKYTAPTSNNRTSLPWRR